MSNKVLFVCTGNYYRSRFAEMLFNALALSRDLAWVADSRGLEPGNSNIGPVYPAVLDRLKRLGFPAHGESRFPVRLKDADLESADLVIALSEAEHRPLMSKRFGQWTDRTLYWDVPDLNLMSAENAFTSIEEYVTELIRHLQNHQAYIEQDN